MPVHRRLGGGPRRRPCPMSRTTTGVPPVIAGEQPAGSRPSDVVPLRGPPVRSRCGRPSAARRRAPPARRTSRRPPSTACVFDSCRDAACSSASLRSRECSAASSADERRPSRDLVYVLDQFADRVSDVVVSAEPVRGRRSRACHGRSASVVIADRGEERPRDRARTRGDIPISFMAALLTPERRLSSLSVAVVPGLGVAAADVDDLLYGLLERRSRRRRR